MTNAKKARSELSCPWWCEPELLTTIDDSTTNEEYLARATDLLFRRGSNGVMAAGPESHEHVASERPLRIAWGSTVCHGYSGLGKLLKSADPGERSHNVWVEERRLKTEDIYFHENHYNYPSTDKQGVPLKDTHDGLTIQISGTLFGLPYCRKRCFTVGC
jgi:hypothetical protein